MSRVNLDSRFVWFFFYFLWLWYVCMCVCVYVCLSVFGDHFISFDIHLCALDIFFLLSLFLCNLIKSLLKSSGVKKKKKFIIVKKEKEKKMFPVIIFIPIFLCWFIHIHIDHHHSDISIQKKKKIFFVSFPYSNIQKPHSFANILCVCVCVCTSAILFLTSGISFHFISKYWKIPIQHTQI